MFSFSVAALSESLPSVNLLNNVTGELKPSCFFPSVDGDLVILKHGQHHYYLPSLLVLICFSPDQSWTTTITPQHKPLTNLLQQTLVVCPCVCQIDETS